MANIYGCASLGLVLKPMEQPSPRSVDAPPLLLNRRFVPRMHRHFAVRCSREGLDFEGVDLSFGGLMCLGAELLWPGAVSLFELTLPGEPAALELEGSVLELVPYRRQVAMRVRFRLDGDAAAKARRRIAAWMARV